ncbi:MAG: glutamate synthase subunit beta [Bacteroidales bacterium]|nr:glutamate synthase subunit beta [Bacteroidales bacterium]
MGDPTGFIKIKRKEGGYRPLYERVYDFGEVEQTLNAEDRKLQASRCMDCGIPFCHWACPVGSVIPEWQDALYRGKTDEAYSILNSTNSFPEITGRVCPAPCEKSCVLGINDDPVTIRENECATVENAFASGIVRTRIPENRTSKKVAIIGSGPAGLSAADLLNQAGHEVHVFEKNDNIGGLLRYGIPDFKLNKSIIDRRTDIFKKEGIVFKTNVLIGKDILGKQLLKEYDAVVLAIGSEKPRDLPVEGRNLDGIHLALDFLIQSNKRVAGQDIPEKEIISAKGKHVVVIGGGDTGSDCVGTSVRQGAAKITQIEILPKPPEKRNSENPWPYWPQILRTSSSHQEGCTRKWSLLTKKFTGENGKVKQMEVVSVEWTKDEKGQWKMIEARKPQIIQADLVLLAMGFVHPVQEGLLTELGVDFTSLGNVQVNKQRQTSVEKVFAAGDVERGASLVVHAIQAGREVAKQVHDFLMKEE